MKKADEILKEAQDREFRRVALIRAGVIRVSPRREVPADDQERTTTPEQDESR
jgi:hypothetical protein